MKHLRPALVALLLAASVRAQAIDWRGLWQTPDQRGEALMQHGDAAGAAQSYTDPRRKAYAQIEAGHYADAAKALDGFDDADSQYNRGNALAHTGDLEGALKAYDAALARDPHNLDARHNRDLVAQALQQQQQQQQQSQSQQQQQQQPPNGKQDQQASRQQQQQQQSGGSGQPGDDQKNEPSGKQEQPSQAQNGDQSASPSKPSGSSPDQPAQQAANQGGDKPDTKQQAHPGSQENGPAANPQQTPAAKDNETQERLAQPGSDSKPPAADDAEQARRDVAASVEKKAATPVGSEGRAGADSGENRNAVAVPADAPRTEQQLAEQQWLRQIPDDPGGLLRRKFMLEYEQRHRQAPQDQQTEP